MQNLPLWEFHAGDDRARFFSDFIPGTMHLLFFSVTIMTVSYVRASALTKNNMQEKNDAIYSVIVNKIRCERRELT